DAAQREGLKIDYAALEERLGGVRVYPVVATTGRGFAELKEALARVLTAAPPELLPHWPELRSTAEAFAKEWAAQRFPVHPVQVERLLVDANATSVVDAPRLAELAPARKSLFGSEPPLAVEARQRYRWVNETLRAVESPGSRIAGRGAALVEWLNRPWP